MNRREKELKTQGGRSIPERPILKKCCFKIIDDSILWANQFLDQAKEKQINSFRGFYYELHDDAEIAIYKTLTIISLLEEKNFLSLTPVVEDLTSEIDQIKVLVSKTTLEQVEEILKNYKFPQRMIL